ncbi:MAG: galactokinase [Bacteroidota bacterium]|nr:galactokinase [Bacteroidota bacterium]
MIPITEYTSPAELKSFINSNTLVVRSPGRINLIGEHTDYNYGFVLPAAIDKAVYVAIEKNAGNIISLHSVDFNESVEVELTNIKPAPGHWSTYILGVVDQLITRGHIIKGFKLAIYGDVPLGAGLSSSAAVECAAAFALNELFVLNIERIELVKIAQLAEHEFAGVKCGIMDQFASVFGKKDSVIKLDCRSLEYEYFPVNLEGYKIVLLDSQVKHSLASTEYNVRRSQCEEGVALITKKFPEVESLRDVSLNMIEECLGRDEIISKRCRYVVEENIRLQEGCNELLDGNIKGFGKKMFATHKGLSEQYEVSCKELDFLVEAVKDMPEVIGARMMGGGFGGCTINIVKEDAIDMLINNITNKYKKAIQKDLKAYVVQIEDGTSVII